MEDFMKQIKELFNNPKNYRIMRVLRIVACILCLGAIPGVPGLVLGVLVFFLWKLPEKES